MSDPTYLPIPLPQETNDKRPLPEIIADHYGFPLAYHDDGDERYYAVQDWIRGVAQPADARIYWDALKRRLKKAGIVTSTWCRRKPYRASNGAVHQREHATAQGLYIITQRMDANTGLRNDVLQFLAKAGVVVDEIRIDPEKAIDAAIEAYRRQGKSEKWIQARIMSKVQRLAFTAAFRQALREEPQRMHYAQITDELRLALWKRSTAVLRVQMGLKKKDNLRDNQSLLAMTYETLAEGLSTAELEQQHGITFDESKAIVRSNSEFVAQHAEAAGKKLGIDIATNRPLLDAGR